VKEELERLKKVLVNNAIKSPGSRPPKAEIILLKASYSSSDHSQNAVNTIKAVDGWVHNTFRYKGNKWSVPSNGLRGIWHSKQILIPEAQYDALSSGGSKSEFNAIAMKEKVSLAVGLERGGMRLFTITGERANLGSAAEKLAQYWA
jgi:hypothetical protein